MTAGRKLTSLLAGLVVLATVACSDSGVTGPERLAPGSPAFDGGGWTGSGSRIEQQDSVAPTSSYDGSTEMLQDTGSVGRGGGWTGSGS